MTSGCWKVGKNAPQLSIYMFILTSRGPHELSHRDTYNVLEGHGLQPAQIAQSVEHSVTQIHVMGLIPGIHTSAGNGM